MKFNPDTLVHRVILKPYILPKKSEGGIDLTAISERTQAVNTDRGEILMFGPRAWKDFGCETPPVKIGDKVIYAKYGAKVIKNEKTDELFIICNDEDILVEYKDE